MLDDTKFKFERPQLFTYSEENILNELEKVAKHFNYTHFRRKDFDEIAIIHSATIERHYNGSWSKAMKALEERLKLKNIKFDTAKHNCRNIPENLMFEEMERIWVQLGHRPSRNEWTSSSPKISYDAIYKRFGGWTNACLKFIEYKTGDTIAAIDVVEHKRKSTQKDTTNNNVRSKNQIQKSRAISLNIRIKVLSRDKFRCVFCGKSPATDIGTQLHIDHIIPFSKGGTNTIENLQTLCEKCNLGKSNEEI